MTPETLTALKASIAHHEENLNAETPGEVKLGAWCCALCAIYREIAVGAVQCNGCPVKERTGCHGCEESPYTQLWDAFMEWNEAPSADTKSAFLAACRAEIEFLRSLLPEEHA